MKFFQVTLNSKQFQGYAITHHDEVNELVIVIVPIKLTLCTTKKTSNKNAT